MDEQLIRAALKEIADYIPGKSAPGAIKLSSNENPFGPSPQALKALSKAAKGLQAYPDQMSASLRYALADKFHLSAEDILCGNGADDILQIIGSTFLNPGDETIIPQHAFGVYELVTRIFSARPVFVPLNNFALDLPAMIRSVSSKTKMVFLNNPNNPTGSLFNAEQLEGFMRSLPEHVLVLVDEAYAEYAEAESFPSATKYIREKKNLLVVRTFSKIYGLAGMRCGYVMGKRELIKPMFKAKMPFNVNSLAQAGALAALQDHAFIKKTYKNNLEGKHYLYQEFDRLGLDYKKTEANFIFVDLKRQAEEFCRKLLDLGVSVRPLNSFGLPDAIRISIGDKSQNKKLVSAIKALL